MMPTSISDVYRDRKNTAISSFVCDLNTWEVPEIMPNPQQVDYLTDEESEGDNQPFDLKIPSLDALIGDFEKGDEVLEGNEKEMKDEFADLKVRGFEKALR